MAISGVSGMPLKDSIDFMIGYRTMLVFIYPPHTITYADDYIIIAVDLNGHLGEKSEGHRCHGRKACGIGNGDRFCPGSQLYT